MACGTKFGAIVGGVTPPFGGVTPPSPTVALSTAPPLDGLTPKLGGSIILAGVGGGGPDGAPRPATAANGDDPLAETGIGGGGPFGPPEASEGSPRGECVLDSSESLGATTWVVLRLLRTGGGVRDVARSPVFRDGTDMARGYNTC